MASSKFGLSSAHPSPSPSPPHSSSFLLRTATIQLESPAMICGTCEGHSCGFEYCAKMKKNPNSGTYDEYGFKRPPEFDPAAHEAFMSSYLPVLVRRGQRWAEHLVGNGDDGDYDRLRSGRGGRKVKRFVRKGVPSSHRAKVWMILSGAEQLKSDSPSQYSDMLSVRADPHSVVVEQINTDLHRTFPTNIYFNKTGGVGGGRVDPKGLQQPLFNVLLAFAHANPHVGYCQGLNYVAGLLLLVTRDEETTFFLLRALAEKLLPEFYGPNVPGLLTEVRVFAEIIKSKCPQVHNHVESFRMPWALVCSKWFVCLYSDVLPVETVLRLWDCLFNEGSKILLRAAIALVSVNQEQILKCSDFADLVETLKGLTISPQAAHCHEFVSTMFEVSSPLPSKTISKLRSDIGAEVRREQERSEERKKKMAEERENAWKIK